MSGYLFAYILVRSGLKSLAEEVTSMKRYGGMTLQLEYTGESLDYGETRGNDLQRPVAAGADDHTKASVTASQSCLLMLKKFLKFVRIS